MDDNLSTKSSDSSLTTSGEYEIVTDSIINTPIEQQQIFNANTTSVSTISSKSPTLNIANNQNINDLHHAMIDALREIDINSEKTSDVNLKINKEPTLIVESNREFRSALDDVFREIDTSFKILSNAPKVLTLNKQKSLTLSLAGTSSPILLVPENDSKQEEQQKQQQQQLVAPKNAMKSQTFNRHHNDYVVTPKSDDTSTTSEHNRVGHSVFYDCIDASPGVMVGVGGGIEEKQDLMKSEKNDTDEEVSEIDQGCTIFSGVTYLGAANINAPKSEIDIYRIMNELNSNSESVGLKISVSIPNCSDGLVVLHDAETKSVIATYEIQSIILYFRGPVETAENGCFAFTWLHGDSLFQCHVFRCHIPEAVNQVSACFQKAFRTYPASMTCSLTSAIDSNMMNSITSDVSGNPINAAGYEFIVSLEIREKVTKNSFSAVPRDRNQFKLRANTDKEVIITVKQTPSNILQPLFIERCFGVLLSPGKLVRQGDMQLIDMVSMSYQIPTHNSTTTTTTCNTTTASSTTTATGGGTGTIGGMVGSTSCDNTSGGTSLSAAPLCLQPYVIRAEWKANEAAFEQLNVEATKTFLTVAVDIVVRGIRDPVRFVIETPVVIQSASEIRIMDHFISKRPMTLRFYLQLERTTDEFSWKVSSIDPSEEINEPPQPSLLKFGMNNLSRIVRSSSIISIEDECQTDYSSDGDEPLLSGTGEVSKDCSQDKLDEWDPILKEWDGERRPKNLAPLVRLGIPEALREKIWQKLANVEGKTEMLDMYKILITKETKCETVIQRDIHRTFPAHKCFKEIGGSGQDSLFKVSKAYAVYDSEVGYCQGLSFIAASLLLHMPEEDAFCVLVALMYDYGLRDLYKQGFEVLYLRLYQLDRLIKEQLPKLYEHFIACGIETHMYASQWFLTLFTARFPLCFVFHVLDVFLLDGVPLLFQVAVTLLSICENDLRQLDFEGILKYFRVTLPKKCRSPSQARRVMKMACERKIKKLKQYEEEFQIKKQHKKRMEKEAKIYENRFGEERRKLVAEIEDLKKKLNEANERAIEKEKKHTSITQDYKQIIQRLESDMTNMNETVGNIMNIVSKCSNCIRQMENTDNSVRLPALKLKINDVKSKQLNYNKKTTDEAPLGPLDPLNIATHRIRELELELAQAKLAHVEAECRNQDLNHQLNATMTEMQSNRNSWQPWLSKTLNSLQEKVTTRGSRETVLPTFQSYTQNASSSASAGGSETNSPSSNQEFKAFSVGGSPKLPAKFQAVKLRNSIDSLRNIVVPLETNGGRVIDASAGTNLVGGLSVADHFRQHLQPQSST